MKRNFDEVMEDLKETIYPSDFLVDFSKVTNNISNHEINLNILNTLIGKENIEEVFEDDNTPDETVDVNDLIGNQLN